MTLHRTEQLLRLLRTIGLALVVVLVVLRLRDAAHFFASAVAAIRYPFELDFGEGPLLSQTTLLMSGRSIYQSVEHIPYTISNYPPVYHVVSGVAGWLLGNALAAGRLVSVLSSVLTAGVIAALVWRAAAAGVSRPVRALAATAGGLAFLSVSYTASWSPLMRVDMLADLFAFVGVLVFVSATPRRLYWSALAFLLALYTKQSSIAAPAACVVVALRVTPSRGLRLAGLLVGLGLGIFLVLNLLTRGHFFFHTVTANSHSYSWSQTLAYLSDLKMRYLVELAVALVAARSLLAGPWPKGAQRLGAAEPAAMSGAFNWARPVLGVYLLTAFLVSLTVGKMGSEVNHLIEFMGVVCACVAVAVADAFADTEHHLKTPADALGRGVAAVLLPALLVWPVSGISRWPGVEWLEVPAPQEEHEMDRLLERIRQVDGPVLSQNLTLLVLANKPVEFQPFDMTQLARLGYWDQKGMIELINRRHFALIVLAFDVNGRLDLTGFSLPMIEAIRDRYAPVGTVAHHWLYAPR